MLALFRYGDGTARLTVEQNLLFPNVPEDRLDEMRQVNITSSLTIPKVVLPALLCSAPACGSGNNVSVLTAPVYTVTYI